ncbi:hypothetical protein AW024_23880 [Shigella sonnei]|nr:hypothetical protein AWZ62_22340 [Shigella sonnei]OCC33545.1 hypothetical protein AWZ64_18420 [Shigella sonnei]OCC47080.1 hypothetical protein AWZ65_18420 [Shigella sonnei]OCC47138.1 hypothetical protein AWZ66_19365 [Shigella sonnei]OCD76622.1 hypothetical protein AW024_23880 [Shigella sonnei]
MNEVQQITLILSTMASRVFMAEYLMEVLLNLVDIKMLEGITIIWGSLIIQPLTEEDRQFMTGAFPPVR